jgi:Domain of unknown function (DUF4129)
MASILADHWRWFRMFAALALAVVLAPAVAADGFDYRKTARNAATNLDVQQSLPEDSTQTDAPKSNPTNLPGPDTESGDVPSLTVVWDQLKWVALAFVAAGILVFLASRIAESRRATPPISASLPASNPARGKAPPSAEQLLAEADACAAQGRYRDAMHCVLLAAMTHIGRRFRDGAPESATSREMIRAAQLNPAESSALRDLVTCTDRAWFGEYPSDAGDYAGARHCFQSFLSGGETA